MLLCVSFLLFSSMTLYNIKFIIQEFKPGIEAKSAWCNLILFKRTLVSASIQLYTHRDVTAPTSRMNTNKPGLDRWDYLV